MVSSFCPNSRKKAKRVGQPWWNSPWPVPQLESTEGHALIRSEKRRICLTFYHSWSVDKVNKIGKIHENIVPSRDTRRAAKECQNTGSWWRENKNQRDDIMTICNEGKQ
jgi:hypothetical protein